MECVARGSPDNSLGKALRGLAVAGSRVFESDHADLGDTNNYNR
jgi:hypothetical protein